MKTNGLTRSLNQDNIYYCKNFINSYYSKNLTYRASDLLKLGLSPQDLDVAIKKALTACRAAGHRIQQNFLPVYTSASGQLIRDCKLSRLGYALVLLNAKVQNPSVAAFQMKVIAEYLKKPK